MGERLGERTTQRVKVDRAALRRGRIYVVGRHPVAASIIVPIASTERVWTIASVTRRAGGSVPPALLPMVVGQSGIGSSPTFVYFVAFPSALRVAASVPVAHTEGCAGFALPLHRM